MITIVILSIVLVFVACAVGLHLREIWRYRHVPGVSQLLPSTPFKIPFFAPYMFLGNYPEIMEVGERLKKYPLFRITCFNETVFVTNSLEAVRHVMLKKTSNFTKPPLYSALNLYGSNIVSLSNEMDHRRHRKIVEPAFHEKNLRELVGISNNTTDLLLKRLESSQMIELNSDMTDVAMDIIGKSNFGVDLNMFNESIPSSKHTLFDKTKHLKSFYDSLEVTNTLGIALHMFVPSFLHGFPLFRNTTTSICETKQYIEELISARSSSKVGSGADLLSLLLESNENDAQENKLSKEELISDSFIFLLAGHETSATNLGHLLCELAKNQEIQDKCIAEIDCVLGGQDFTYDDYGKLHYVKNCINESLRRHTPVGMIPKTTKSKDVICGFPVPKDAFIWVDIHHTHLDERYWRDPFVFNPDRFNQKNDPLSFLPFSFGARKCLGYRFSYVETLAIIIRLLQRYRFELEPGKDPRTYYPKEKALVTVKIVKENLVMKKREEISSRP